MNKDRAAGIIRQWRELGQDHLFAFWQIRPERMKQALLSDLRDLDPTLFEMLLARLKGETDELRSRQFEPIAFVRQSRWLEDEEAAKLGQELLSSGKAAVVTVAGGQGSRLGYEGPKGCFPISPIRNASLFQIHSEKILAARRRYNKPLYWYIMTSPLNIEQTKSFFLRNSCFGLPEEEIRFFAQGLFPTLTNEGKLVLAGEGGLFRNPNGHGGTLKALLDSGCLQDMERRGVEELFYFQVDNPLVRIPDPCFLGFHRGNGSQMSSKVIAKAFPEEKLGSIGRVEGKACVIEYSDLNERQMHSRDEAGRLLFSHGSIAVHILNVSFLHSVGDLPLHLASKMIQAWVPDSEGGIVHSREAMKFEMFIFDAIPLAKNPLFMETSREEEFAPLKNSTGADSIETCRLGISKQGARWLERCGIEIPKKEGQPIYNVEISPVFAEDGETLKQRLAGTVNIIDEDILLR